MRIEQHCPVECGAVQPSGSESLSCVCDYLCVVELVMGSLMYALSHVSPLLS